MIDVVYERNERGLITAFTVKGHAGYGQAGSDIICAAVSAICYTVVGYFDDARFDGKEACYLERDGLMRFRTPELKEGSGAEESAKAVLDAFLIGLKQVEASYGKKYVRVRES